MPLSFYKYQATGNDFILIDDRQAHFDIRNESLVRRLCDRHFGIGADGLILLRNHAELDFQMVYFNSDGRQSSMCGNGGRCITMFAAELGIVRDEAEFMAVDGYHFAKITQNQVSLKMSEVFDIEREGTHYYLDTGSPHWVEFKSEVDFADETFVRQAQAIRYAERFAVVGTNVNFVEKINHHTLKMRTYERGCETETLSCGTGVVAAALSASFEGVNSPVKVITPGGELSVSFVRSANRFEEIFLTGPAELVFIGQIPRY